MKKFIIFLIMLSLNQISANAAFWNKDVPLGNEIKKEEYPDSIDVEPKGEPQESSMLIVGGVEEVMDVSLEECLKYALGNNPRIQAAMQDVFASDARIKQAWSSYFPQVSWQTGYSRIKQLQLSDALGENLIFKIGRAHV